MPSTGSPPRLPRLPPFSLSPPPSLRHIPAISLLTHALKGFLSTTPQLRCGSTCPNPKIKLASQRRPITLRTPTTTATSTSTQPTTSNLPPSYTPPTLASPPNFHPADPEQKNSVLHPRVAVLLGVEKHWHLPLLFCRALSTAPAAWWGLRCALTFMGELLLDEEEGAMMGMSWSVERRFRVTEVFLAVLWCSASAYLSFYFTDCLMSRWLLNYTPQATLVRLLTINSANAYITSWVLYLSGGSEDPRLLLPAWISIASTYTFLYHLTHPRLAILKETSLSISVFSIASFISMVSLLLQLHLTRANDPPVPLFLIAGKILGWARLLGRTGRVGRELCAKL